MIYFDENKNAFGFEIENPICSIEDQLWVNYAATDKWDIVNGVFTDISQTPEYAAKKQVEDKAVLKLELQKQIDELDKKRIRAIAEPAIKDGEQTWLEYYTQQIQAVRTQIAAL